MQYGIWRAGQDEKLMRAQCSVTEEQCKPISSHLYDKHAKPKPNKRGPWMENIIYHRGEKWFGLAPFRR